MFGVVRACLFIGAAARLSLILEMHSRTVPNAPKLVADLRNQVANVSGLNSTDIAVEVLPDNFFFPCPEILPSFEPESEMAVAARQLHGVHGPHGHWSHGHWSHGHHHSFMDDEASGEYYYYYYDEKPMIEDGLMMLGAPAEGKCAECLAAGMDYCIAEDRCTERATRTCRGAEDHVTGSPEFSRAEPGHSMKCPRSDAPGERGFLGQDAPGERGFLGHHGRKGFPVLLEVRGVTSDKLIHDLRAHAADLSATGCETVEGQPCKVTFELYECGVRARHAHHRHHSNYHHHIPPLCGLAGAMMNVCCCLFLLRLIRICLCGRRRGWRSQGTDGSPFLPPAAQGAPVQGRIVNGVILPHGAPSAGPAVPPSTAPSVQVQAQAVQPAAVFPVAPVAPVAPAPAAGYCSSCGAPHSDTARFCGACGQPLSGCVSSGPAYPQLQAPMQAQN
jgi:hypothetical protein